VSSLKAARGGAIPDTVDAISRRVIVFSPTAGGRARQKDGSMRAVSGAPLTVTTYTQFTDMTVSRRPKRATSVAVLGVLLTPVLASGEGIPTATAFPSTPGLLTLVSNGTFVAILFNIIYQDALAAVTKGSPFWLPLTIMFSRIYKSHCADRVLPCFHPSSHEHLLEHLPFF